MKISSGEINMDTKRAEAIKAEMDKKITGDSKKLMKWYYSLSQTDRDVATIHYIRKYRNTIPIQEGEMELITKKNLEVLRIKFEEIMKIEQQVDELINGDEKAFMGWFFNLDKKDRDIARAHFHIKHRKELALRFKQPELVTKNSGKFKTEESTTAIITVERVLELQAEVVRYSKGNFREFDNWRDSLTPHERQITKVMINSKYGLLAEYSGGNVIVDETGGYENVTIRMKDTDVKFIDYRSQYPNRDIEISLERLAKLIRENNETKGWSIHSDMFTIGDRTVGVTICELHEVLSEILETYRKGSLDQANTLISVTRLKMNALQREITTIWGVKQEDEVRTMPELLSLIHSEVTEAYKAVKKDDEDNLVEEFADIIIRILDIVGKYDLDLTNAILSKIAKNCKRSFRHGNKKI